MQRREEENVIDDIKLRATLRAILDVVFFMMMGTEFVKYENETLSVILKELWRKHVERRVE